MKFISESKIACWGNWYFKTVGVLLFFAGAIKVMFLSGDYTRYLHSPDPLFREFSELFVILAVVALEVAVATSLFLVRSISGRALLTLWLSSLSVAYRVGIWYYYPTRIGCCCVGFFWKGISLSEQTVDRITFSILMFMIAGSFLVLILNYLSRKSNVEKIQTK
ncbi:MAG: hypothetical protein M0Q48_05255 [Verrucomicrobia bacterium]|jgi:hypothetical protein|nr:hypothetical protein [Verrucomicrobiota bacterium]